MPRPHDAVADYTWLPRLGWSVPLGSTFVLAAYAATYLPASGVAASVFATSLLVAAAALVVGGFVGFLFGIPRALQAENESAEAGTGRYAVNTNLEQISDWLTKIIVGVGLVELTRIAGLFADLMRSLTTGFGARPSSPLAAGASTIFFSFWGFLLSYLLTRTYLTSAFRAFDVGEVASKAASDAVNRSNERDAEALRVVSAQLNSDTQPVTHEELRKAIGEASPAVQEQIINQVRMQRQGTWQWRMEREGSDARDRMFRQHERTLAVLEALAEVRPDDALVRGELGYALKDNEPANLSRARTELTEAIRLGRPSGRKSSWFQFNLAVVEIRLDAPADVIVPLLREVNATGSQRLRSILARNAEVKRWLARHQIDLG